MITGRRLLSEAVTITILLALLLVLGSGCADLAQDESTSTTESLHQMLGLDQVTPPTALLPPGPLVLVAPAGWQTSTDGYTVAQDAADLSGSDPSGPRVIDITSIDSSSFVSSTQNGAMVGDDVQQLTLGGFSAVAVTMSGSSASGSALVTTTIVVDTQNGSGQIFLLQAPEDLYDTVEDTLLGMIQFPADTSPSDTETTQTSE